MKGYLNQENTHFFIERQGRQYFRTGDLAEFRDGVLYLLGRGDHQIKTRGYRVNPNEVESLAAAAPGVAQSIVVAVPGARFGNLMVAFVNRRPGELVDEATLRHHVARLAPRYMIPERFILNEYLPSAATGKVDRSSLKARAIR
ncbi:AMP-binding protein [Bradyrhizobium sp. 149]|nr:AMP-binding protein [Bradyrhizobium sp. 149]